MLAWKWGGGREGKTVWLNLSGFQNRLKNNLAKEFQTLAKLAVDIQPQDYREDAWEKSRLF